MVPCLSLNLFLVSLDLYLIPSANSVNRKNEKELIISVQDFGCGIDENDLPHVKEKFYKSNLSVKGSGIGLAVADEIVSRHGGSMEISSKQNIGTLVVIRLPLKTESEQDGKDI